MVFDILIANMDRHDRNISADYSRPSFKLFDHSLALFGSGPAGSGNAHLAHITNAPRLILPRHCLIAGIDDEDSLGAAVARVESMPAYFIESVVGEAGECGLAMEEVQGLTQFLVDRKRKIGDVVSSNRHLFPGIARWRVF